MLREGAGNTRPMLILQDLWHSEQFAVILLAFACLLGLEGDVNLKVHQAGARRRDTHHKRGTMQGQLCGVECISKWSYYRPSKDYVWLAPFV
jgi:hypothetical protein